MAKISFRTKVQQTYHSDDTPATAYIQVPELKRSHCDMNAFRQHAKYGAYANSDLFLGMLARIRRDMFGASGVLKLDAIPQGVYVDTSGFLALVEFDV
jgi:hypothetical protein